MASAAGVPPGGTLLLVHPEPPRLARMAFHGIRGGTQVLTGHQVGVRVVVGDRAVLVGAGDPVEVEDPVAVVVPQRPPQPGRLHQQFHAGLPLEVGVAGGLDVPDDGVGHAGVHVEGGGAGRPVGRALRSRDGPPGERGAGEAQLGGAFAGLVQGAVPPAQRLGDGPRRGVGEHGSTNISVSQKACPS
ncbi:hypothetical protein GCM10017687_01800 [Streptomyces echinatus]